MHVQPYLFFEGRCEEALDFYQKALGAEVQMMMRFKDSPDQGNGAEGCGGPGGPPGDKVMHATFRIGDTTLNASDGNSSGQAKFNGITLSLTVPNPEAADRAYAALREGGQERLPLTQTFFSPRFGMVADKFGVSWMVYVAPKA